MERNQSIEKWCKIIQSVNEDGLKVVETVLAPFFTGSDQFTTKDPDKLAYYHEYAAKVTAEHEERMKQIEREE